MKHRANVALRIRNLIAAREANTAKANQELQSGDGWLCDHGAVDHELAAEIDELFRTCVETVTGRCACGAGPALAPAAEVTRVPAYNQKTVAFPDCAKQCALIPILGAGECDSVCPWKFDHDGNTLAPAAVGNEQEDR